MPGRRTVVVGLDLVALFLKKNDVRYTTNLPEDATIVQVGVDGQRGVLQLVFESEAWQESIILAGQPTPERILPIVFTKLPPEPPASEPPPAEVPESTLVH